MRIKLIFSLIICIIATISIYISSYCAELPFFDSFELNVEGEKPKGWSVVEENGGSIKVYKQDGSNIVALNTYQGSNLTLQSNAYIYYGSLSFDSGIFSIGFKFNARDLNGIKSVMFRDNQGKFIQLMLIENNKLTFMPNNNPQAYQTTAIINHWYNVQIEVNSNSVSIFLDGTEAVKNVLMKEANLFNFKDFTFRVQNRILSNTVGTSNSMWVDNISLSKNISKLPSIDVSTVNVIKVLGDRRVAIENLCKGNVLLDIPLKNLSADKQKVMVICALYEGERLKQFWSVKQELPPNQDQYFNISLSVDLTKVEPNSYMKIFLWADDTIIPIVSPLLIENDPNQRPFADVIIQDFNNFHPYEKHPRLLVKGENEFVEIKSKIQSNVYMKSWFDNEKRKADNDFKLTQNNYRDANGLPKYNIYDGLRMLNISGETLERIQNLSFVYKMTGESKYAERAWQILNAAASFPDWNPPHYLDTAEMTIAFAIGYDWLYNYWSPERLQIIKNAIIKHGLQTGEKCYNGKLGSYGSWVKWDWNWNVVCNGGLAMGAIALLDEKDVQDLCGYIIESGLRSLDYMIGEFAPDGAWKEGPGYWHFTVSHLTLYIASLESALGTDYGIFNSQGVSTTCDYPIYMRGTNGTFNINDSSDSAINAPEYFWFAEKTNDTKLAGIRLNELVDKPTWSGVKDLLWFDPNKVNTDANLLLDKYFRNTEVASFRSSWKDADATFVAIHGGQNNVPHGNLDAGTFVLDALGERWAWDLGVDNYNQYGYFDNQIYRWWYYVTRAEGHNTLVINPDNQPDQKIDATEFLTEFISRTNNPYGIVNLSNAYSKSIQSAKRGIMLINDRKNILIQDEVVLKGVSDIFWFMHTKAGIVIAPDKQSATLTIINNGVVKRLWVKLLPGCNGEMYETLAAPFSTSPNPNALPQNIAGGYIQKDQTNSGFKKLGIKLSNQVGNIQIPVLIVPLTSSQSPPDVLPQVTPLSEWKNR